MNNFLLTISENIEINNPILNMDMLIWGVVGGLMAGAVLTVIGRRSLGIFVKRLKAAGASTPESAVTLADLGMEKDFFLRAALKTGKPLRKYALIANEDAFFAKKPSNSRALTVLRKIFSLADAEETAVADLSVAKFYMPEEERRTAEVRFDAKGADLLGLLFSAILLVALGFALRFLLPELLTFLDNFLPIT